MQKSLGWTLFQLFDKVLAAALIVVALFYVAMKVIEEPRQIVDEEVVQGYLDTIERKQKDPQFSAHKPRTIEKNYLYASVGDFRPTIEARPVVRPFVFSQPVGAPPPGPPVVQNIVLQMGTRETDKQRLDKRLANARVSVADPKVCKATVVGRVLEVTALAPGRTTVTLKRQDAKDVTGTVVVRPKQEAIVRIDPPGPVSAEAAQGRALLQWGASRSMNATVTGYRILRATGDDEPAPYVEFTQPEKLEDKAEIPTVRVADRKPGPPVTWAEGRFSFADSAISIGEEHAYVVFATGKGKGGQPLVSAPSEAVKVGVPEPFTLKFFTRARDRVTIAVTVPHRTKEGEIVPTTEEFLVTFGQEIGRIVGEHYDREKRSRFKNVDFRTGYQVLDILHDQPYIYKTQQMGDPDGEQWVRQSWRVQQKVLLINKQGRIKVLTPAARGAQ
jgi:hypothetical protein